MINKILVIVWMVSNSIKNIKLSDKKLNILILLNTVFTKC